MKNKKLFLPTLFISIFAIILLVIISCEQDSSNLTEVNQTTIDENVLTHVQVKDGILHFDDAKYVSLVASEIQKMSYDEKLNWEQQVGFKSMFSCIDDAMALLENCSSVEDYNDILDSYNDILRLNGEDIEQVVPLDFYTSIINRDGVCYVGSAVYKITSNQKIIVWSGDETKLDISNSTLKSASVENNGMKIISDDVAVHEYGVVSSSLKSSPNGTIVKGSDLYDYRLSESGKRKIKFWIRSWRDYWANHTCDVYYECLVEVKVENWKKKIGWSTYKTSCSWDGVDVRMTVPIQSTYRVKSCGGGTVYYDPFNYLNRNLTGKSKSSSSDTKSMNEYYPMGDIIHNNYINVPVINGTRGRATNRGIGDRYATICLGRSDCYDD